jgi:ectoine hydroxylase-related dioxygenase (phytanoyl-CoA dioxygenase family)
MPNKGVWTMAGEKNRLSKEEVLSFHDQGYLGPFTLCSEEEMAVYRQTIDQQVLPTESPLGLGNATLKITQARHLDKRVVYDLCSHPGILERVQCIIGEDLVLWRSNLFMKLPGDKSVPWHQDANYWPIEPPINVSAWLAIDEAVIENSCVQLIPGSHRSVIPHIKGDGTAAFKVEADPAYFDASNATPMTLKPGQFFLFNERLLHYSAPNISNKRRLGLAVRLTVPFVRVKVLYEGHKVIIVSGQDRFGLNKIGEPPAV